MTYESALKYTDESIRQCKELASFLKKRQAVEMEYARSMLKITQTYQKAVNPPASSSPFYRSPSSSTSSLNAVSASGEKLDVFRAQIMKTSTWRGFTDIVEETQRIAAAHNEMALCLLQDIIDPFSNYIRDMENTRKLHMERGIDYTRNLQDAYAGLKKVKKEYEGLQALSNEAASYHWKAQQNPLTKDRELEKLSSKLQAAVDKARRAEETLQVCEEICRNAQDDYFQALLPRLYDDIRTTEEERLLSVKRVMSDYMYLEKLHGQSVSGLIEGLGDRVAGIDISEDAEEFVLSHFPDERRVSLELPAKNVANPIFWGTLNVKKGDVVTGWKPRFLIIGGDKKLYIYDDEERSSPREIINLKEASVSTLHDSFFNRKYCFQLFQETSVGRLLFNFSTDSSATMDAWMQHLLEYCYCCAKCATSFRFSNELGVNQVFSDKDSSFRSYKSIQLSIMEAKELPYISSPSRLLNAYCIAYFDDVKQARTAIKPGDAPFWAESFTFGDVRPHFKSIRILLYHHNRIQRDAEVGVVVLPLDGVKKGKKVEEWYPLRPLAKMDENINLGSIRISYVVNDEQVLPLPHYEPFLQLMVEPTFASIKLLGSSGLVSQREAASKSVLRVMATQGKEIDVVKTMLQVDIEATDDPNILFRGNTLGTKMMDQYMKLVGMDYLHSTIGTIIRSILKNKEACEVDPTRVDGLEAAKRNHKRLMLLVVNVWDAILKSVDNCPSGFVAVFNHIRSVAEAKWGVNGVNDAAKYSAISGFIFLRFFCPAILSPKLFGIINDFPDASVSRTLTLIAKVIQNLANLTEFGQKEPYMVEIFGEPPYKPPQVELDVRRETEGLFRLFSSMMVEIKNQNGGSDVEVLSRVIDNMHDVHRAFEEGDVSKIPKPAKLQLPITLAPPPPSDSGSTPTAASSPYSYTHSPVVRSLPPKLELDLGLGSTSGGILSGGLINSQTPTTPPSMDVDGLSSGRNSTDSPSKAIQNVEKMLQSLTASNRLKNQQPIASSSSSFKPDSRTPETAGNLKSPVTANVPDLLAPISTQIQSRRQNSVPSPISPLPPRVSSAAHPLTSPTSFIPNQDVPPVPVISTAILENISAPKIPSKSPYTTTGPSSPPIPSTKTSKASKRHSMMITSSTFSSNSDQPLFGGFGSISSSSSSSRTYAGAGLNIPTRGASSDSFQSPDVGNPNSSTFNPDRSSMMEAVLVAAGSTDASHPAANIMTGQHYQQSSNGATSSFSPPSITTSSSSGGSSSFRLRILPRQGSAGIWDRSGSSNASPAGSAGVNSGNASYGDRIAGFSSRELGAGREKSSGGNILRSLVNMVGSGSSSNNTSSSSSYYSSSGVSSPLKESANNSGVSTPPEHRSMSRTGNSSSSSLNSSGELNQAMTDYFPPMKMRSRGVSLESNVSLPVDNPPLSARSSLPQSPMLMYEDMNVAGAVDTSANWDDAASIKSTESSRSEMSTSFMGLANSGGGGGGSNSGLSSPPNGSNGNSGGLSQYLGIPFPSSSSNASGRQSRSSANQRNHRNRFSMILQGVSPSGKQQDDL
ncbi:Ras GTPase-activating protein 1 [Chytridiales sp. JEL 0842]|nr:Ras GTPase-activating protein 1 [Chytridiales sp. JEL 0842]